MIFGGMGRILVFMGLVMVGLGGLVIVLEKGFPAGFQWIGRLPGDLYIQRKNFTFYFPLATGFVISVLLSVILWLLMRR
jgi:ribosomal protein RSM22 (predicted rRNA methylase)